MIDRNRANHHRHWASFLILIFIFISVEFNGSVESASKRSKQVRLQIPESQRMSCLAKLLCGVQGSSPTSAGAGAGAAYSNQAQLLRKYFETYSVSENSDLSPSRKKLSNRRPLPLPKDDYLDDSPETEEESTEADDESADTNESGAGSSEDAFVKPPPAAARKPAKKQKPTTVDKKQQSSVFDTGVPIIEQPVSVSAAAAGRKGQTHVPVVVATRRQQPQQQMYEQELFPMEFRHSYRTARELATKSARNCNTIEGCSFTFKQIFVSLQEDSNNIMGNENIAALSSADSEEPPPSPPVAEAHLEQADIPLPVLEQPIREVVLRAPPAEEVAAAAAPSSAVDAILFEDDDELSVPISPFPQTGDAANLPSVVINENEDEVENEDVKIYDNGGGGGGGVEDFFLSADQAFTKRNTKKKGRPSPVVVPTAASRPPATVIAKRSKIRTTAAAPIVKLPPRLTINRFKSSSSTQAQHYDSGPRRKIVNYHSPLSTKTKPSKLLKGTSLGVASTRKPVILASTQRPPAPSTAATKPPQLQLVSAAISKSRPRPNKRPIKYEFEQVEEDYDDSRDTYDEEAQFEIPDAEDLDLDLDFDDELEEEEEHGGGGGGGGGKHNKKNKKKKNKKKKNKKKKNKKKKNKKNKKKKGGHGGGGGGGGWGGWGYPKYQYSPAVLAEIGGRPLSPTPESPHPGLSAFSQSSGWATLYRKGDTGTVPGGKGALAAGRTDVKDSSGSKGGADEVLTHGSESPSALSAPLPPPLGNPSSSQQQLQQDDPSVTLSGGFSIQKLASPFTNLVKLVKSG